MQTMPPVSFKAKQHSFAISQITTAYLIIDGGNCLWYSGDMMSELIE